MLKTFFLAALGGMTVVALGTTATPAAGQSGPVPGASMDGTWVLNRKLSGGPGAFQRGDRGREGGEAQGGRGGYGRGRGFPGGRGGGFPGGGEMPPGGMGGRPGGMGRGGFPGGDGRAGGRDRGGRFAGRRQDMQKVRRLMGVLLPRTDTLVVSQADSVLDLRWGAGRALDIPINGKTQKEQWDSTQVKVKARWKKGELYVERQAGGMKVQEVWSRSPGSPRLLVETKVSGKLPRDMKFDRVYDIAAAPAQS